MAGKIKGAGVNLGKALPGKPFPPAGKKDKYAGTIGNTGNQQGSAKSYAKGKN